MMQDPDVSGEEASLQVPKAGAAFTTVGPYKVYGGQDPGLKAQDLSDSSDALERVDLVVNSCPVLAAEQFSRFMELTGYTVDTDVDDVLQTPELEEITAILQQILSEIPLMTPVAIRSSARSERGGLGIYNTTFLLLTGDMRLDLPAVWQAIMEVYASEISGNAKAWRADTKGAVGVAVMFHPVVGAWHGAHFFPLVSGRGFTSYFGQPLLRLVMGIATEGTLAEVNSYSSSPHHRDDLAREIIERQKQIAVIDWVSRRLVHIPFNELEDKDTLRNDLLEYRPASLFHDLTAVRPEDGEKYIELAVAEVDSRTEILQCAPFDDKTPEPLSVDTAGLTEIARSTDIVNHGIIRGRRIIWVGYGGWSGKELADMESLNGNLSGYAVFFRENEFSAATTLAAGRARLDIEAVGYKHFSHAGLVCEIQFEHTESEKSSQLEAGLPEIDHSGEGRGGLHFAQLCTRANILFQAGLSYGSSLRSLPGAQPSHMSKIVTWDVDWLAVNDMTKKEGVFYIIGEPRMNLYSSRDVDHYGDICYDSGGRYEKKAEQAESDDKRAHLEALSRAFYDVCFLIPCGLSAERFEPFLIGARNVREVGGKEKGLEAVDLVLTTQGTGDENYAPIGEVPAPAQKSFGHYLAEFRKRLEAWDPASAPEEDDEPEGYEEDSEERHDGGL